MRDGILDVTVPLIPGRVPLYPGDTELSVERTQAMATGSPNNVSTLRCSVHSGTHVDAPVHFLPTGGGVETVPLDVLIGPVEVIDATAAPGHINAAAVEALHIPPDAVRVLFRTRNSALWDDPRFVEDFVAVTADGARALVDRGIRLVGIDYLSIAPYDDPAPTHVTLLNAGVAIVETLDLRRADPGQWYLTCLPTLIPGSDGAPARAVLTRL